MLVTAHMAKDVAQLLVGAGNPGSREVFSPMNLVLEPPARTSRTTNSQRIFVAYRNAARLASHALFLAAITISEK